MFSSPRFRNADAAFAALYNEIHKKGIKSSETVLMRNVGFYIDNPMDNTIKTLWRNWSDVYALREWDWYLSQNRSVKSLVKYAPIWDKMHCGDYIVNSNYGYQWNRNKQILNVIAKLKANSETRQAYVTIYDGKEWEQHAHDTPCTNHIGFVIENGKLCMNVVMRSNDLWYGFCNDQYCFSKLQFEVAKALELPIGWYYHFAHDMHIYTKQQFKTAITYGL